MLIKNKFGCVEYAFEDDYVHIFNLIVKKEYRRKGHGTELVKQAIKEIKATGWKDEILIVTKKKWLKKTYERLGLKVYPVYL